MADVEYRMPLRTHALSTAFGTLMVIVFVLEFVKGHGPFRGVVLVGAAFFAAILVRTVPRAVLGRPFAVLAEDGMTFNYDVHVTWDEIASVTEFPGTSKVAWKGYLGIELHDPDAYLARIGPNRRRFAKAGIARGTGPIRLPGEAFPVPLPDVVATMRRFRPGLVTRVGAPARGPSAP